MDMNMMFDDSQRLWNGAYFLGTMDDDMDFNRLFKKLLESLEASNRLNDVHNICRMGETPEGIFRALWKIKDFHKCLNIKPIPPSKSEKEAQLLIEQGRELMDNNQYSEALDVINKGLMKAPWPSSRLLDNKNCKGTNNLKKNISEKNALMNGYRNRSEILFNLKQYKKCISDIDRIDKLSSITIYSNENEDHNILLNRRLKCSKYIEEENNVNHHTNNSKESCDVIVTQAVEQIDEIYQEMKFIKSRDNDLPVQKTIELLLQGANKVINSLPNIPQSSDTREHILVNKDNKFTLPEPNLIIPSLSAAVKVDYASDKGRFIVAARDIRPGERVHVEKCFIGLPDMSQREKCCCVCLTQCQTPIPCSKCDIVVFCSDSCRNDDKIHNVECKMLPTCLALGMEEHALQTLRILFKMTFIELKAIIPIIKSEEASEKSRIKQGFNSKGFYDSTDYRTVYHLETNMNERKSMELFCKCVRTFMLLNILHYTKKFFIGKSGEILIPSDEDLILTGSAILNHLLGSPLNTYALYGCQIDMDTEALGSANEQSIAMGIFGAASLFNHSCNPATVRCNYGDVLVMHAKHFIPAGTEVSTTYGHTYNIDRKEVRKSRLLMDYKFECACEACSNDWPHACIIQNNIKLKYIEPCYKKLLENKFLEKIIDYCTETKKSYLADDDKVKMRLLEEIMIDTIEFLDKCIELPSRQYLQAQKVLVQCLEKYASVYNFRI